MVGSTYGGPAREMRFDTLAPGLIADATFGGHLAARSFEANEQDIEDDMFRREMPSLTYNEKKYFQETVDDRNQTAQSTW
jgi:acyl-CoA thioesterase